MKLLISVFSVVTVLSAAAAGETACPTNPSKAFAKSGQASRPAEPGGIHCTDAHGKKWLYRQTPFGVARIEDVPDTTATPTVDPDAGTKAVEFGDTIRFERPGPFGVYKWQKKKADLSTSEQAIWDRQQASTAAIGTAASSTAKAKQD